MKTKHTKVGPAAILLLVLFIPSMALGATVDETVRGWFDNLSAWQVFLIPTVTVLIMGFRKFVVVVPDQLWPWLAPFVGAGLDYLASKAGLWTGNAAVGTMMGGLAVWFSQMGKQTKEIWKEGPKVTTSGVSNAPNNSD